MIGTHAKIETQKSKWCPVCEAVTAPQDKFQRVRLKALPCSPNSTKFGRVARMILTLPHWHMIALHRQEYKPERKVHFSNRPKFWPGARKTDSATHGGMWGKGQSRPDHAVEEVGLQQCTVDGHLLHLVTVQYKHGRHFGPAEKKDKPMRTLFKRPHDHHHAVLEGSVFVQAAHQKNVSIHSPSFWF